MDWECEIYTAEQMAGAKISEQMADAKISEQKADAKMSSEAFIANAVRSFLEANSVVESTALIEQAVVALDGCVSSDEAFPVPISCGLLSMSGALSWALLLSVLSRAEIEVDASPDVAAEASAPSFDRTFDANAALKLIEEVFDKGVQDVVWDHFDESEDDDSYDEASGDEQ